MVGHDLRFLGSPSVAGQRAFLGFNEEEPLVRNDMLAVWQSQYGLPVRYLRADTFCPNARLFRKFSNGCLLEGLPFFNAPAGGGPVILARERALLVNEAEEQYLSGAV
jgi:hypothetical protein